MKKTAHLSRCGTYRYELGRSWAPEKGQICWIMLNPSTADANQDDPTLRRCIHFTQSWGFGELVVVNLYPFRSSRPADLWQWAEHEIWRDYNSMGVLIYDNLSAVACCTKGADLVVAAWGNNAKNLQWKDQIIQVVQGEDPPWPDLYCLGTTKGGAPKHPMARGKHRVPDDQQPVMWRSA